MTHKLKTFAFWAAASALVFIPAATTWAVPLNGAAHLSVSNSGTEQKLSEQQSTLADQRRASASGVPFAAYFRDVRGRGLLLNVWVNDRGPYTFALDTGAGSTILSTRVANEAGVSLSPRRAVMIEGLSGIGSVAGQEAFVRRLAVGEQRNVLPSKGPVIVTERLAPGIDGVLDPVESYWPLGFEIDIPRGQLSGFDPRSTPLNRKQPLSANTAMVQWLVNGQTRRPFVMLGGGGGRRALLDTGSGFGLAVTEDAALSLGISLARGRPRVGHIRDLGGGTIAAHRIAPSTVRIGDLVLRGIPTDLLPNVRSEAPILLGLDALRPFRLTFDPINRLIRITPG